MRRANRNARQKSQWDRDTEQIDREREDLVESARQEEANRASRMRSRRGRDETRSTREREGNWIEGKSEGTVLLLTWRSSYYNRSINTRSLGTMDQEGHVGMERETLI